VPKLIRRVGPLGLAITAYDVWKRLPAKQRKQVLQAVGKHGPKLASRAIKARAKRL
jgi:hypothetical protein